VRRNIAARESDYGKARIELPQFCHEGDPGYALRIILNNQVNMIGAELFQGLNRVRCRENRIACAFQNQFANGKFQFLIVDAEDGRAGTDSGLPEAEELHKRPTTRVGARKKVGKSSPHLHGVKQSQQVGTLCHLRTLPAFRPSGTSKNEAR
jgi:hypothetical protein